MGRSHTVPADVVERYADRRVGEALRAIAEEELHDRGMCRLLEESNVAVELYARGHDGEHHEQPLSAEESWNRVVGALDSRELEVSLARAHKGGRGGSSR
jgi:hypothetical protein